MTDNDIKKALECCSEPAGKCCCEVCPLHHREDSCTTALIKMSVELVNRQQAEIKRYLHSIKLLENDVQTAKSEAIKEFAERLKNEYADFDELHEEIRHDNLIFAIDDLVKEMTENDFKTGDEK